jgi:hypothetical protein
MQAELFRCLVALTGQDDPEVRGPYLLDRDEPGTLEMIRSP